MINNKGKITIALDKHDNCEIVVKNLGFGEILAMCCKVIANSIVEYGVAVEDINDLLDDIDDNIREDISAIASEVANK